MSDDQRVLLALLTSVDKDKNVTQRRLARELGVAVGLVNAYLNRCARKGWVKMRDAPARRYAYYLTPQGFAEKSRLTAEYLRVSLSFFRDAREQARELLQDCRERGWTRIAVYGANDLSEIVLLTARECDVAAVGVVDPERAGRSLVGITVAASLNDLPKHDALVFADLHHPQENFEHLAGLVAPERLLPLPMLRISRERVES